MSSSPSASRISWGGYVVVGAVLAAFIGLPRMCSTPSRLEGKPAPVFSLQLTANPHPLDPTSSQLALDQLRGHAVILDFWATWCGPCKTEAPILDGVARKYKDKGVVVIGVNTDDPPGAGSTWARSHALSYPIVYDGDNRVARMYDVRNLPTLVVVSKSGNVVAVRVGVTDESELEKLLEKAM